MPVFNRRREERSGKRHYTLANSKNTETNSSKSSTLLNAHSGNTDSESEERILTQEEVDEQNETYVAPVIKQLEDLTRLIREMSSFHQQNLSRVGTSANSSRVGPQPDRDVFAAFLQNFHLGAK